MNDWWVRSEESYGVGSRWHGPYLDVDSAQRAAAQLTKPGDAPVPFAEVIHGSPGGKGVRVREFLRGMDFLPGESGYYPTGPSARIDIPSEAERGA